MKRFLDFIKSNKFANYVLKFMAVCTLGLLLLVLFGGLKPGKFGFAVFLASYAWMLWNIQSTDVTHANADKWEAICSLQREIFENLIKSTCGSCNGIANCKACSLTIAKKQMKEVQELEK